MFWKIIESREALAVIGMLFMYLVWEGFIWANKPIKRKLRLKRRA